jgi:hypothetical protein
MKVSSAEEEYCISGRDVWRLRRCPLLMMHFDLSLTGSRSDRLVADAAVRIPSYNLSCILKRRALTKAK